MNDSEQPQPEEDRPSTPELLGNTQDQIRRQGEPTKSTRKTAGQQESSDSLYQAFLGTASIILLVLGIAALIGWGWTALNAPDAPEQPAVQPTEFIHTDISRELTLATSTSFTSQLTQARNNLELPAGSWAQIYPTVPTEGGRQLMPTTEFLDRLDSETAAKVSPHLGDNFMYGLYKPTTEATVPYLIFAVENYADAYGALLQTERDLAAALEPLGFSAGGAFTDVIIQNQDVRISHSTSSGSRLYYSFPRQHRLVFTTNEAVLREIFNQF